MCLACVCVRVTCDLYNLFNSYSHPLQPTPGVDDQTYFKSQVTVELLVNSSVSIEIGRFLRFSWYAE